MNWNRIYQSRSRLDDRVYHDLVYILSSTPLSRLYIEVGEISIREEVGKDYLFILSLWHYNLEVSSYILDSRSTSYNVFIIITTNCLVKNQHPKWYSRHSLLYRILWKLSSHIYQCDRDILLCRFSSILVDRSAGYTEATQMTTTSML